MTRRILLADADAFFVAVARLVDPEGAGKAPCLIVGGSARDRGVVTSASYEARKFGVHSAMPMARATRLCPQAMVVPVPMAACTAKGREIKQALLDFTPAVEQASSDEFYLDMTGTEKLYQGETLTETAQRMRRVVQEKTQLTVSIGGGTSRVIAKRAAGVAKPSSTRNPATSPLAPLPTGEGNSREPLPLSRRERGPGGEVKGEGGEVKGVGGEVWEGVHIVEPGDELAFMRRFQLADIHGIGPKFQERLAKVGLRSVEDALKREVGWLTGALGERAGMWLYDRIRGLDEGRVVSNAAAKSISRDQTFSMDLDDPESLDDRLRWLVDKAAADMRDAELLARTVTVRLRDADFSDRQASHTVPEPISSERAVLSVARELLQRLRAARPFPARLLGVALSNFVQGAPAQLSLLEPGSAAQQDSAKDRAITQAMDALRDKFGRDAITRGRTPDA